MLETVGPWSDSGRPPELSRSADFRRASCGRGWPIGVCNSAAVPGYRSTHLSQLDRIPLDHGVWRPIRRPLAITGFAINAYSAEAGQPVIEPHDETSAGAGGHEEVYLVASGAATFTVAGEAVEAPMGTLVVEPGVMREAVAIANGTTIVVIGGRPDSVLPPSPFEFWYAALPAERAGDLEQAHEIVSEGLEQWPHHETIHYVLGSLCARAWGVEARRSDICESPLRRTRARGNGLRTTATSTRSANALPGELG
jgi:hypothetical protein